MCGEDKGSVSSNEEETESAQDLFDKTVKEKTKKAREIYPWNLLK